MEKSTIHPNELCRMLEAAVEALNDRSLVLEKATTMSKQQLANEIDHRIGLIASGNVDGNELEQVKAEARALAVIKLRRG